MLRPAVTSKINHWMDFIGFKLNSTDTNRDLLTEHYFLETFNFFRKINKKMPEKADFMYFDTYGEEINVKSLTDLQEGFFENLSELK